MLMSARPSAPTSTPWGAEVSATVCVTMPRFRSITFSVEFPLLVTYSQLPSMDMAPASGVFPHRNGAHYLVGGVVEDIDQAGGVVHEVQLLARFVQNDIRGRPAWQLDDIAEGGSHGLLRVRQPRRGRQTKPDSRVHVTILPKTRNSL